MSKKASEAPMARLFFALDPPAPVREGLLGWQREQITDPALRPVAAQALHCTLCFLGSRPEGQIPRLTAELTLDLAQPTEIRLDPHPVAIPARRPRLFAVDAVSDEAVSLQARLERALIAAGLDEPKTRPFRPHFTIARVRAERGGKRRPRRIGRPPGALPETLLSPFHAVRIALYRSYLRSSGSHYVSLASLELPQPA